MSAIEDAPEWACRVFCERANLNYDAILVSTKDEAPALRSAIRAGGLLISKHEKEPVDPLLIEAREIIKETYGSTRMNDGSLAFGEGPPRVERILAGEADNYWEVRVAVAALRRGIELGKSS